MVRGRTRAALAAIVCVSLAACSGGSETASTTIGSASSTSASPAPDTDGVDTSVEVTAVDLAAALIEAAGPTVADGTAMQRTPTVGGVTLDDDLAGEFADLENQLLSAAEQAAPAAATGTTTTDVVAGFGRPDRRDGGLSAFTRMGAATSGIADVANGPAGTPTSGGGSQRETASSAQGTGSVEFGLGIGRDVSGATTATLSLEMEATKPDGTTASAKVSGTVTGQPCPDESGSLVIDVRGEIDQRLSGPRTAQSRHTFHGTVTAVFGDDGEVASVDLDIDLESNRTEPDGKQVYLESRFGISQTDPFGGGPRVDSPVQIVRQSQQFKNDANDVEMFADGRDIAMDFVRGAFQQRRFRIQNNGCVTVQLDGTTRVAPSQQVTVKVRTRHVVEGADLDLRAEATLSGTGNLDPASLPSTPGELHYTAGADKGDAGTISVISRSRRGIGTADITITVQPSFRVDSPAGVLRIEGPVCALDKPFTLNVVGEINGTLTFTPAGTSGGSYSGSAVIGRGSMQWSGNWSVSGADTDNPVIEMEEGTTTLDPVGPVPSFWAGGQHLTLVADAAACPAA